jgi:hypothetical protein
MESRCCFLYHDVIGQQQYYFDPLPKENIMHDIISWCSFSRNHGNIFLIRLSLITNLCDNIVIFDILAQDYVIQTIVIFDILAQDYVIPYPPHNHSKVHVLCNFYQGYITGYLRDPVWGIVPAFRFLNWRKD